uniref:Uncharacterized protein n=1 Tax=Cannabis sativa TaxID=3483 RepID=A0A803Q5Q1_CANSA
MAECHKIQLGLPFRLLLADFLLNEANLRTVNLLGSDKFTCHYNVPKYSSWEKVPVPADEESQDYVAHVHYLQKVTPGEAEEEASQDLNSKDMLNSPTLVDKRSKERAPRLMKPRVLPKNPKEQKQLQIRRSLQTNSLSSLQNLLKKAAPNVASASEQPLWSIHQVKFSGFRPEMVFLEPSCPLPIEASTEGSQLYALHATNNWGLQRVEMLEIELRQTRVYCDVMAKKLNDSEFELSRVKEEAEKKQRLTRRK